MKAELEQNSAAQANWTLAMPVSVIERLAARFRPCGLFLLALGPDGTLAWYDSAAPAFFQHFVLPQLRPVHFGRNLQVHLPGGIDPTLLHRQLPGVALTAIPVVERRHNVCTLLLAGRDRAFSLDEDLLRLCGRLGIESIWLGQQARKLPEFDDELLQCHARLLMASLRDQLQISGLEREMTDISEQLASTYEELSLVYQVSSGMKITRGVDDFFRQTCQEVLTVMGTRGIGIAREPLNATPAEHIMFGHSPLPAAVIKRLGDELIPILQKRKGPLLLNDLAASPHLPWMREHARQLLAVPLQRSDNTFGCIFALDKEVGEFDSTDAKLLTSIANESAVYLENTQLFEDVHSLMMGLLHSLTSAIDAKDAYTCGHSERVALLSRHLAQQISLSDFDIEQIYMAGLLHDVGKIGVPEAVLQKTGKLTAEEFDLMKKHPAIGARILQDVPQMKELIPGVLHHHERYDGKGYPSGLSGHNIPLMGRIICLADSFDAMTSNRTYRKALPLEVALAEIRRCSGTHFDPELAEAFLSASADHYRELLQGHQQKSKQLLELQEAVNGALVTPKIGDRAA